MYMMLLCYPFSDPSTDEGPPAKRIKTESHDHLSQDQSIKVSTLSKYSRKTDSSTKGRVVLKILLKHFNLTFVYF